MPQRQRKAQPSARAILDAQVAEADLQKSVLTLASKLAWLPFHDYDSRMNEAGLPDLILCRDGRLIFAELKRQDGRLHIKQRMWLAALSGCAGVEVYVWRPADWSSGKIEEILQ